MTKKPDCVKLRTLKVDLINGITLIRIRIEIKKQQIGSAM